MKQLLLSLFCILASTIPSFATTWSWTYDKNNDVLTNCNNKTTGSIKLSNVTWQYSATTAIYVGKSATWQFGSSSSSASTFTLKNSETFGNKKITAFKIQTKTNNTTAINGTVKIGNSKFTITTNDTDPSMLDLGDGVLSGEEGISITFTTVAKKNICIVSPNFSITYEDAPEAPTEGITAEFENLSCNINESVTLAPKSVKYINGDSSTDIANDATITYSITKPTTGYTLSGNTFLPTAAGIYEVTATATYGDFTATGNFTVNVTDPNGPQEYTFDFTKYSYGVTSSSQQTTGTLKNSPEYNGDSTLQLDLSTVSGNGFGYFSNTLRLYGSNSTPGESSIKISSTNKNTKIVSVEIELETSIPFKLENESSSSSRTSASWSGSQDSFTITFYPKEKKGIKSIKIGYLEQSPEQPSEPEEVIVTFTPNPVTIIANNGSGEDNLPTPSVGNASDYTYKLFSGENEVSNEVAEVTDGIYFYDESYGTYTVAASYLDEAANKRYSGSFTVEYKEPETPTVPTKGLVAVYPNYTGYYGEEFNFAPSSITAYDGESETGTDVKEDATVKYYLGEEEITLPYTANLAEGTHTIKAVVEHDGYDSIEKTFTLTINYKEFGDVDFDELNGGKNIDLAKLGNLTLTPEILDAEGDFVDDYTITYTATPDGLSFDDNVMTIADYGTYTVTATISATGYKNATATFTVTATDPNAPKYIYATDVINSSFFESTSQPKYEASEKKSSTSGITYYAWAYITKDYMQLNTSGKGTPSTKSAIYVLDNPTNFVLKDIDITWHGQQQDIDIYSFKDNLESINNLYNPTKNEEKLGTATQSSHLITTTKEDIYNIGLKPSTSYTQLKEVKINWYKQAEAKLKWQYNGADVPANGIIEDFNVILDSDGNVISHPVELTLVATTDDGGTYEINNQNLSITSENAEMIMIDGDEVLVSYLLPNNAEGYTVNVSCLNTLGYKVTLPDPLTIKLNPATVNFTERFTNGLSVEHNVGEYTAENGHLTTHELYLDNGDTFIANNNHFDCFTTSFALDADEDTLASLACKEDEDHTDHHGMTYVAPTHAAINEFVEFAVSTPGAYKLSFDMNEQYKPYFTAESYNKSYAVAVTPSLAVTVDAEGNQTGLYFFTVNNDKTENLVGVRDNDKGWLLFNKKLDANGNEVDIDLSHVFVHTPYTCDVYYKFGGDEEETETPNLPYSNGNLPQFAQAPEGYHILTGRGIDLSGENATKPLILMTQINGATTTTNNIGFTPGVPTSVAAIEAAAADAEYYTIEGLRVNAPLRPGVYVRRANGSASVIFVK